MSPVTTAQDLKGRALAERAETVQPSDQPGDYLNHDIGIRPSTEAPSRRRWCYRYDLLNLGMARPLLVRMQGTYQGTSIASSVAEPWISRSRAGPGVLMEDDWAMLALRAETDELWLLPGHPGHAQQSFAGTTQDLGR